MIGGRVHNCDGEAALAFSESCRDSRDKTLWLVPPTKRSFAAAWWPHNSRRSSMVPMKADIANSAIRPANSFELAANLSPT